MIELVLVILGIGLGLSGPAPSGEPVGIAVVPAAPAEEPSETPGRQPEPQIATGRFTTALEIRPILQATEGNWIAIREYQGQDLLYFTHLLSWRCGLWEIRYGINDVDTTETLPMERCHDDTAAPNALIDQSGAFPIYIEAPLGSIETVSVEIYYDDGTSQWLFFDRADVLMP